MKDFLDVLNKAKNVKLNLAIFIVVFGILWIEKLNYVELESLAKTLLQSLFFVTVIRLVYSVICLVFDSLENRRKSKKAMVLEMEKEQLKEVEKKKKKEKMYKQFHELDVYQLYIIQELKRQNHLSVSKGAPLFMLKNANIIYTPAVGDRSESASLTFLAKELLHEELWEQFITLKREAIIRFFNGMQPLDLEYFLAFLDLESIYTGGNIHKNKERVFSAFSKSVVFSQPQRNYTYVLDPVAKEVVESFRNSNSSKNYG